MSGPNSPQLAPEVGYLTPGLGLATTSMDPVQEVHVLRRWVQQRLRLHAGLMEVRRSRSGVHDQRVRRELLLLAADRARWLYVVRGRQRCSPRLASVWGFILVRLLRLD